MNLVGWAARSFWRVEEHRLLRCVAQWRGERVLRGGAGGRGFFGQSKSLQIFHRWIKHAAELDFQK
jgi:hypothetical protein